MILSVFSYAYLPTASLLWRHVQILLLFEHLVRYTNQRHRRHNTQFLVLDLAFSSHTLSTETQIQSVLVSISWDCSKYQIKIVAKLLKIQMKKGGALLLKLLYNNYSTVNFWNPLAKMEIKFAEIKFHSCNHPSCFNKNFKICNIYVLCRDNCNNFHKLPWI